MPGRGSLRHGPCWTRQHTDADNQVGQNCTSSAAERLKSNNHASPTATGTAPTLWRRPPSASAAPATHVTHALCPTSCGGSEAPIRSVASA